MQSRIVESYGEALPEWWSKDLWKYAPQKSNDNTDKMVKIKFSELYKLKDCNIWRALFKKISWILVRTLSFIVFYFALFYLPLPRSAIALKMNTFTIIATIISSKLVATGAGDMGLELSNSFIPQNLIFFNLSCSSLKSSISRACLLTWLKTHCMWIAISLKHLSKTISSNCLTLTKVILPTSWAKGGMSQQ